MSSEDLRFTDDLDNERAVEALSRVRDFADDMRAQGIHVGLSLGGGDPRCVTCDERWPCAASQTKET